MTDSQSSKKITEIVAQPGICARRYIYDLWLHREVFLLIAMRDILMRYRQMFFGVSWALVRPLLILFFFVQIFGRIQGQHTSVRYYLLVLCAAPVWILFSGAIQNSISSIVKNSELISKIYFPRMLLVGSAISVNVLDFLIGLSLVVLSALVTGLLHLNHIWLLPFTLLSLLICVTAWSLCVAAINSKYRDLVNVAPFILQLLLVGSPIGYTIGEDSVFSRPFYYLNPLVGIIEAMRFSLLDYPSQGVYWGLIFSTLQSLLILCFGFIYFRKIEDTFSDVI